MPRRCSSALSVVQVNYVFDESLRDPEALLDEYTTLTGWSEALAAAGAAGVTVAQRFCRNSSLTRNGIDYLFWRDEGDARPKPWTWPRRLHETVANARPDIVHVNGLIFPVQTWLLRQALPKQSALIVQDHGSGDPLDGTSALFGLPKGVRRRGLQQADGFMFSAAGQEITWRATGLIASSQRVYRVMESSTTLRPIDRAAARQASGVAGEPAVLWVGRLNANKDPLTVLEAFEASLTDLPGATLTMIYGAEELLPAVHERVRSSALLSSRVRLVGRVPRDRMPAFYSAADIFVLGSHHEGSGYAVLEALACGVTPVVTDIPAFRAMTAQGSLGALWTPGDASSCSRGLVEVALRPSADGRARIRDHFERNLSWPAIGAEAMDAYQDVVTRRRRANGKSSCELDCD